MLPMMCRVKILNKYIHSHSLKAHLIKHIFKSETRKRKQTSDQAEFGTAVLLIITGSYAGSAVKQALKAK